MKNGKPSEFALIRSIQSAFDGKTPQGVLGIGDDCAIIPQQSGLDTLVSTDMLIQDVHFRLEEIPPFMLGWKSAAVNISDIAAMGGTPTATFLSLALPENISGGWMADFVNGYKEISAKYGVALLGGDTTASANSLCINVTVLGTCPCGKAILRSGAMPGDLICVTGVLGDSATGFAAGLECPVLLAKHFKPEPRVREASVLAGTRGVHAMMDISDGIGGDLRHILERSGVGAIVDTDSIPMSDLMKQTCQKLGLDPLEKAISGGEDYELLFTMDPSCKPEIDYTVIGRITKIPNQLVWDGSSKDFQGFKHF